MKRNVTLKTALFSAVAAFLSADAAVKFGMPFAGGQSNMGIPLMRVVPRHGDEKGAMIAQYVRRGTGLFTARSICLSGRFT